MKSDLHTKHCEACEGIANPLSPAQVNELVSQLAQGWEVFNDHKEIKRSFRFNNFYETMAFVNALAWIANTENHHPDLQVGYNYCHVSFMTHALKGLSQNDFICAAKTDRLFA